MESLKESNLNIYLELINNIGEDIKPESISSGKKSKKSSKKDRNSSKKLKESKTEEIRKSKASAD